MPQSYLPESDPSKEDLIQRINKLETALQDANAELKATRRYRQLFDEMEIEVHIWELLYNDDKSIKTWRLLDANKAALRVWGRKLVDVLGKQTDDIFDTNATEQFLAIVTKIFEQKKPYSWQHYFERTEQYLGMTSIPCEGYFISVGVDVTAIKKNENMHRETILKLKEAIASGNVGLWDWDLKTNETFFSPEWKAQLGYSEDEICNEFEEWRSRLHPDDLQQTLKAIKTTLDTKRDNHETEFRMRHKDGSYRWIISHASLIKDEQKVPIRMVGSHIDISKQKKMEEAVLQHHKMQALGTLAGGIAHDFNNLLTPMLGYAHLVKLALEDKPEELEYAEQMETAALRAKDLVQHILLISRVPTNSIAQIEPVYLHKVLAEVTSLLKTTAHKNIRVAQNIDEELPAIGANTSQIHRVILNICNNAMQSMPAGGMLTINLYMTTTNMLADEGDQLTDCVCLSVIDTGIGMNEEMQKRIFEPFYTTKNKGEERGTGLGLAIVSNVMKQHGGRIEVTSQPGKGSSFTLYFPIIPIGFQHNIEAEAPEKCDNIDSILFIDDEAALCKLGAIVLRELGYQVSPFQNAEQALEHLLAQPDRYQLVITDYAMPEMSGVALIGKLKQHEVKVPVIVITGFTDMVNAEQQREWGCDGILSKPYRIEELKQAINAVQKAKRQQP